MYSIGAAARLSGVPAETIRIWERRYQVLHPQRSAGGHRQYSESDVALLRALRVLTAAGVRIGSLADRSSDDILRAAEEQRASDARVVDEESTGFEPIVDLVIQSARDLDTRRVEELLGRPLLRRYALEVIKELYLPLLERVGDMWHRGELDVGSEHLVEKVITGRIHSLLADKVVQEGGPLAVLACPPGERHEVGLLSAAVVLREIGFELIYLGADLPIEDLVSAVAHRRPRLVVLGVTMSPDQRVLTRLNEQLRAEAFHDVPVLIGGAGGAAIRHAVGERVEVMTDLDTLERRALELTGDS
jgi:DNA-binding transcriptional MerR regulator